MGASCSSDERTGGSQRCTSAPVGGTSEGDECIRSRHSGEEEVGSLGSSMVREALFDRIHTVFPVSLRS